MKIGIFGAGCIGVYLGSHLIRAGHDVVLCGRRLLADEIAGHGIAISNWRGMNFSLRPSEICFATDIRSLGECHLIIVTVKSSATMGAATELNKEFIRRGRQGCFIVSFQNGVRNARILSEALPGQMVLPGMVPFNVIRTGLGCFHAGTSGELIIGSRRQGSETEEEPFAAELYQLVRAAGLDVRLDADMQKILWGKLLLNLNNAVNTLSGLPLRQQLLHRGFRVIVALLMDEALGVLKEARIRPRVPGMPPLWLLPWILRLPNMLFKRLAAAMLHIDPLARSSMWDDVQRGRLTEIDFMNGEVVRLASNFGKKAPLNARVTKLVKLLEQQPSQGAHGMTASELYAAVTSVG